MIISASRRTDIPVFYAEWFMRRIREGYCLVPNPFNRHQVSRVSLGQEDVDAIVFWTRNPTPLVPYLAELDSMGYRYYFQLTLTGYPRFLEPNLPDLARLLAGFQAVALRVGRERVIWRYDPILLSSRTSREYHRAHFAELADELAGSTTRVVISLFDGYRKAMRRLRGLGEEGFAVWTTDGIDERTGRLLCSMARTAESHGLEITSCAEPWDLTPYGIRPGACIDAAYIQRVLGVRVTAEKDPSQRPACGCVRSKDIGVYDTCYHGCLYCYALSGRLPETAHHDPDCASLITWDGA